MAKKIVAITATNVRNEDRITFAFMFKSGAVKTDLRASMFAIGTYGILLLEDEAPDTFRPFDFAARARGEVLVERPLPHKRWFVSCGRNAEHVLTAHCDEDGRTEEALQGVLKDMDDAVLLMEKSVFERIAKICSALNIELSAHHFEGELATC